MRQKSLNSLASDVFLHMFLQNVDVEASSLLRGAVIFNPSGLFSNV